MTLLDLNLELDRPKALWLALESGPQVVGVGLRNIDPLANRRHSYLPEFAAVLDMVRAVLPAVPLVGGGPGFSMFAREIMQRYSALDIGVVLEGERTFPAVLGALARGGPAVWRECRGRWCGLPHDGPPPGRYRARRRRP